MKSVSDGNGTSLRDRLRRETADAHARVDGLFGSHDLSTETGYAAFLLAQSKAWETLRPILDADSLARADALRADLRHLDLTVPAPLPDIDLPEGATLGHRYVLEGSRLGSTVLLRELNATSPELSERAGAYLTESGRIEPWKQLSTGLQKDRNGRDKDQALIQDALFVFGLFEKAWRATDSAMTKVS